MFEDPLSLLQEPHLLLFCMIVVGLGIGMIKIGGISFGSSGVLFAGLLFGHWGRDFEWSMMDGIGTFGLVLFVYAVGLGAGQTFFRTFVTQGRKLIVLATIVITAGAATTLAVMFFFQLPRGFAAGLFAGSMTSTPALASAMEGLSKAGRNPTPASIGYGLAYPIGVVVTVLFVQFLPRWVGKGETESESPDHESLHEGSQIIRQLIEVCNPAIFGRALHDLDPFHHSHGQVTRVKSGDKLIPIKTDHVFEEGQIVLLVAEAKEAETLTLILGNKSTEEIDINVDRERTDVVVTNHDVLGQSLRNMHFRSRFGVTISRIERYGHRFVPSDETVLVMGDRLTAVGPKEGLKEFLQAAGHRVRKLHETDLLSMAVGLAIGIGVGLLPFHLPIVGTITLGMAGGPLLVGLLLAHFGRFLGVVGYMPIAARMVIQELGLILFLASAGFAAGSHFLDYVNQFGSSPFIASAMIAIVPIASSYCAARWIFRLGLYQSLGGTCGAMTSTAALGTLTSKTDSEHPITSYAAAYPVALVLMTIIAQVLVLSSH